MKKYVLRNFTRHFRQDDEYIFMPSIANDFLLPRFFPLAYLGLFFIALLVFINGGDHSRFAAKLAFVIFTILLIVLTVIFVFTYFLLKRSDVFIAVSNGELVIRKNRNVLHHNLDSIDYFTIARTVSPLTWGTVTTDLFLTTKEGNKLRLHSDLSARTKHVWSKIGAKLIEKTGKKVFFVDSYEDFDGEILTKEELSKKMENQFKKKMGF